MGWFNQENFQFYVLNQHDVFIRTYPTSTQPYLPHFNFDRTPPLISRDWSIISALVLRLDYMESVCCPNNMTYFWYVPTKLKVITGIIFGADWVAHVEKVVCVDSQPPSGLHIELFLLIYFHTHFIVWI